MNQLLNKLYEAFAPPILRSFIDSTIYRLSLPMKRNRLTVYDKLHLACGTNILENWANIDLKKDPNIIRLDLTKPLPIENESIHYIFSEHFIEHITRDDALSLLEECYRVMKPEGVIRITTPNLQKLVTEYDLGNLNEWKNVDWLPNTPCQMINEGMRLWGHQFLYDQEELMLIIKEAGFKKAKLVDIGESEHEELVQLECRPFHSEIIIEATR